MTAPICGGDAPSQVRVLDMGCSSGRRLWAGRFWQIWTQGDQDRAVNNTRSCPAWACGAPKGVEPAVKNHQDRAKLLSKRHQLGYGSEAEPRLPIPAQ
jgi:hypothetical protein